MSKWFLSVRKEEWYVAKVDVIAEVSDSFEFLKAHYREVLVPIIFLILLNGAGSFGGSGFSDRDSGSGSGESLAYLLAFGLVLLAVIVVGIIVFSLLNSATTFYIYGHFNAVLRKKSIGEGWQPRFLKMLFKSAILFIFWLVLLCLFFAIPAYSLLSVLGQSSGGAGDALLGIVISFLIAFVLLLAAMFFLMPLPIYYAVDNLPFFESVSRSFSLVTGNLKTFLVFYLVFLAIDIAVITLAFLTCCFLYLTLPVLMTFYMLLWGVALMKVKMRLEAAR